MRGTARFTRIGGAWLGGWLCLLSAACGDSALSPEVLGSLDPAVVEFAGLMNEHRVSVGCDALEWNPEVADVAQQHSLDMETRGFFAHTNPDGDSPFDRLAAAGVDYSGAAENIAYGYGTAGSVLDGVAEQPRSSLEHRELLAHRARRRPRRYPLDARLHPSLEPGSRVAIHRATPGYQAVCPRRG